MTSVTAAGSAAKSFLLAHLVGLILRPVMPSALNFAGRIRANAGKFTLLDGKMKLITASDVLNLYQH